MNTKRVLIATAIGLLCGLFCAYGASMIPEVAATLTTGMYVAIVYNRVLIGFVIGIADCIKLHPAARGAVLGAVVGLAMSITPMVDAGFSDGLTLMAFSVVYGVIIDVVATKFS